MLLACSVLAVLCPTSVARAAAPVDDDGDGFTADVDCDDGDANTFPGAPELCDGVQNDCDDSTWVSDAGLATFFSAADGTATDYTTLLGAGTRDVPVTETLSTDGTLNVCEGIWFAGLDVQASVDLVGVDGKDLVILDGARQQPLVTATSSGTTVSLDGLTLRGGRATDDVTSARGGAVKVRGIEAFSMTDVDLRRNQVKMPTEYYSARTGGAWLDSGSTISVDRLGSANNKGIVWGGSIFLNGSTATIDNASFIHDHGAWGGAIYLYEGASLDMANPSFTDNAARYTGGGGAVYIRNGTLSVSHGSFSGNLGGDVYAGGTTYTFGSDDSITCDNSSGCVYTK